MMGHSEARMTALYRADDLQRRRTILDQMAERLLPSPSFLEAEKLFKLTTINRRG